MPERSGFAFVRVGREMREIDPNQKGKDSQDRAIGESSATALVQLLSTRMAYAGTSSHFNRNAPNNNSFTPLAHSVAFMLR